MTKEEALQKLKRYCAYQERCHQEVRSKILSLKIYGDWLEEVMAELVQEDFLNEERFAKSYVRGKYRIKKWGRTRIVQELKLRNISAYCIKKGLAEIEEPLYFANLQSLIEKYIREREDKYTPAVLKKMAFNHAMTKGYEYNIIQKLMD
jgi:regulatory protein